jgi:hypothetical protein
VSVPSRWMMLACCQQLPRRTTCVGLPGNNLPKWHNLIRHPPKTAAALIMHDYAQLRRARSGYKPAPQAQNMSAHAWLARQRAKRAGAATCHAIGAAAAAAGAALFWHLRLALCIYYAVESALAPAPVNCRSRSKTQGGSLGIFSVPWGARWTPPRSQVASAIKCHRKSTSNSQLAGPISPNRGVRRGGQRLGGSVTLRSKTANPQ